MMQCVLGVRQRWKLRDIVLLVLKLRRDGDAIYVLVDSFTAGKNAKLTEVKDTSSSKVI